MIGFVIMGEIIPHASNVSNSPGTISPNPKNIPVVARSQSKSINFKANPPPLVNILLSAPVNFTFA